MSLLDIDDIEMALRHQFPFVDLPDLRKESEPAQAPPLKKPPRKVTFRASTDIDAVVAEMAGYAYVRIQAAVGSGKSTRLPIACSEAMKCLVIHAFPSEFMAVDTYDYLSAGAKGSSYSLALDQGDSLPASGVVLTTYAWVFGWYLINLESEAPFGKSLIFADEVHESDAYSDFVRGIGSRFPGILGFVETSATHDAVHMPMAELEGDVESKMFERESPTSWSPFDSGKPWSIAGLPGNLLVYMDDNKVADKLIEQYTSGGASAFRLHSRMSRDMFRHAMRVMRDPRESLVVLVADYTFRNSFTFDVSRIVDSGLVCMSEVKDGLLKKVYRNVFTFEKYQTCNRGGRIAGNKCEYYFPKGLDVKDAISSLEGLEIEAAALLYRVAGYAPPGLLKQVALTAFGNVPKDLSAALNGFVPIPLLVPDQMHSLVMDRVPQMVEEVTDVLGSYSIESPVSDQMPNLFDNFPQGEVCNKVALSDQDVLEQLQAVSASAAVLVYGNYYRCNGADEKLEMPGGTAWKDMLYSVVNNPVVVMGMDRTTKVTVMSRLLVEYNAMVAHGVAVTHVVGFKEELTRLSSQYPDVVKRWSAWMAVEHREKKGMAMAILKGLEILREEGIYLVVVPPHGEIEQELARSMVDVLRQAVGQVVGVTDNTQFYRDLQESVGQVTWDSGIKLVEDQVRASGSDEDEGLLCNVSMKPVSVAGYPKYNAVFRAHNPMDWHEYRFADAITKVLEKRGLSVRAVHKLTLVGSQVSPNRVMQIVRGSGVKHRKKLDFVIEAKG